MPQGLVRSCSLTLKCLHVAIFLNYVCIPVSFLSDFIWVILFMEIIVLCPISGVSSGSDKSCKKYCVKCSLASRGSAIGPDWANGVAQGTWEPSGHHQTHIDPAQRGRSPRGPPRGLLRGSPGGSAIFRWPGPAPGLFAQHNVTAKKNVNFWRNFNHCDRYANYWGKLHLSCFNISTVTNCK